MISTVFELGDKMPKRTRYKVLAKITEEVGELAQEVAIAEGDSYKEEGKDGVIGEAIDVAICALDIIRVHDPSITEHEILGMVKLKLLKWQEKEN
jgi:NTP pyrophosphatase (non-canonical NTP hydrolase)